MNCFYVAVLTPACLYAEQILITGIKTYSGTSKRYTFLYIIVICKCFEQKMKGR